VYTFSGFGKPNLSSWRSWSSQCFANHIFFTGKLLKVIPLNIIHVFFPDPLLQSRIKHFGMKHFMHPPANLPLESFLFGCISLDAFQADLQIQYYINIKNSMQTHSALQFHEPQKDIIKDRKLIEMIGTTTASCQNNEILLTEINGVTGIFTLCKYTLCKEF